ncbi:helix-turn-helix transcriptional regulator [Endozoicomonas gorgoniicola]|uniref:Helix-turn-helix transcriptional regulator n=1 Tax=Endozoicomonas gorgoniicola TaxID=1234144 RepID=A0ABT3MT46_9GAMM|nr:helix-turn-helix transcriptional regulator [Endozoicomonas gorgoniicola]MCW7552556.1 helix-turn-helix transcriptional regulator [Endozoicomonas gorgoniicola]
MSDINFRIKEVRKERNLTQNQFCKLVSVSQSHLSEVENGKSKPSLDIFIGMAKSFSDVSLRWLLIGEEVSENENEPLREDLLKEVIEVVEGALEQVEVVASADKKAALIAAAYEFCLDEGVPRDRTKLIKLVKAVA